MSEFSYTTNHECSVKSSRNLSFFRFEHDMEVTRIGQYVECKVCGKRAKVLTSIRGGRVVDVFIFDGEVIKTKTGEITYTLGEEENSKKVTNIARGNE